MAVYNICVLLQTVVDTIVKLYCFLMQDYCWPCIEDCIPAADRTPAVPPTADKQADKQEADEQEDSPASQEDPQDPHFHRRIPS
jgi:hypothetical protein